ncbi:hypothetical protein GCM10011348_24340 [Marinobacterium nitratireducens]|uniref:Secreted protein n=1 Tax=Marinobacterium nitratireducens TaxID=518897 RepID=A0A918DU60_9GAMM|nr:hypothetical protein [Marinobacterium nitratireducens]GGO82588.1 hypothetical protein GCM10011348_24340 [Marinobacterium nitratireducens]
MKRTFCTVLLCALSLPAMAEEVKNAQAVKDGIYAACFRMNIEAKNTYKRIVANDKRSLTVSEEHRNGQLSVNEALSEAEQILKQQRVAYDHLANVLTATDRLGCPDTAEQLGEVEMQ